MSQPLLSAVLSAVLIVCSAAPAHARDASAAKPTEKRWLSSWGTSLMVPDKNNELAAEQWSDATLRQIVPMSVSGKRLRVRFSNVYGSGPISINKAGVALAAKLGTPSLKTGSVKPLTFSGKTAVLIPAGAEYYSDPVDLDHPARADLAVSFHISEAPARQTSHPGARTHSFVVKGDKVMDAEWEDAAKVTRWYQLADIEVEAPRKVGALVAMGDSITDGYGVQPDTNQRWTDHFSRRLLASGTEMAVINGGIGGGRMLRDGLGPNLVSRFDREVLGRSGVTHAMVLIGVNDFGVQHRNKEDSPQARAALLDELKEAHRQLVERAHAHGICVIGATVGPYTGSEYYAPAADNEADRQALNQWIRTSKLFDAVADVDAALRDPANPSRLLPALDSGDHLHPSTTGYKAIADAIPLAALRRSCAAKK